MSGAATCKVGDWVEVERVLLEPADRSPNLPPETAETPLRLWVKGFALADAAIGEELTIETTTGRRVAGALSAINPGYYHTFGEPVGELTRVGVELRAQLAAYRADIAGEPGAGAGGAR